MTTMSGSTFSSMTSSVFFGAGGQGRGGKLKSNFNNRRQKHGGAMQITAMGKKSARKGKAAAPAPPSPSNTGGGDAAPGGGGGGAAAKKQNQSMKSGGSKGVSEGSAYQTETRKIILSLNKVRKVTPQGKELIKNINLGMYLGAKIGILGANGAGKSTLMRI